MDIDGRNCALLVANPGHEVRAHGWLSAVRPIVYVFTDGARRGLAPCINRTEELLGRAGAERAAIFGGHSEKVICDRLHEQRFGFFVDLVGELAADLIDREIEVVVTTCVHGNAPQYVWRLLIDAAVAIAEPQLGLAIKKYEFAVDSENVPTQRASGLSSVRWILSDEELGRKVVAAYEYEELRDEVDKHLVQFGFESFRTEYFYPFPATDLAEVCDQGLRLSEHIAALADVLRSYAEKSVVAYEP